MLRRACAPARPRAPVATQQRARYATAPSQAKAVVYRSFGNPASVLKLENSPLPALGSGDVRVQMLAAPINPADLNMVHGTYGVKPELPAIGGLEGFGVVQEAGPAASLKRGDYVIAAKPGGYDSPPCVPVSAAQRVVLMRSAALAPGGTGPCAPATTW